MDFNSLLSIIQQNMINIIVLLLTVILVIKIVNFFLKDFFFLDMTKTQWNREIPKEVMYKEGEAPPDNLTGWVPLFHSTELKTNQIKSAEFCGHDLVVFRSSSGKVHVLDAYCPHMGTYLPIGKVVGDDVRCPFHGWTFNGDGHCTHVPGLDEGSLPKAKVKVWNSIEKNSVIYFWYDSNDEKPTWVPQHFDGIEERRFAGTFKMILSGYFVDIPINGADYDHFSILHKPPDFIPPESVFQQTLFMRLATKVIYISYEPKAERGPEQHQYQFRASISLCIFGIPVWSGIKDMWSLVFDGPYMCNIKFLGWPLEDLRMISISTPAPGRKAIFTSYVYTKPNLLSRIIGILLLRFQTILIYRDSIIWSSKKILSKPYYLKREKDHADMHKWFQQFHPKHHKH